MATLLHISDVHFGPPHRAEVAEELAAWIATLAPQLVVLSGDLTQRAKPPQFREARSWVESLARPVLAVPGNHDVPLYRVWERLLAPYGAYRRHFTDELEPSFESDNLLVLGVNSAHGWTLTGGRIRRAALRRLEARLARATPQQRKVVVVHHPLAPPPQFGPQRVPRGVDRAMELFGALGVELVLSGHQHQTYIHDAGSFYPDARGVQLAAAGTATSSRGRGIERRDNSFLHITLDGERTVVVQFLRRCGEPRFAVVRRTELAGPLATTEEQVAALVGDHAEVDLVEPEMVGGVG